MENQNFEWENQLSMAMFNSYVRLPEGIICFPYMQIFQQVMVDIFGECPNSSTKNRLQTTPLVCSCEPGI